MSNQTSRARLKRIELAAFISGQVDEPIRCLVYWLNLLPRIETFSSYGGHKGKLATSQEPFDHFYVNFHVTKLDLPGRESLAIIALECSSKDYELRIWFNGEWAKHPHPENICFELRGSGDPNKLAEAISAHS